MFLEYKGISIHYRVLGKGVAIVLLHGFLENRTMWKNIIPELSKRNKVITIDLLGHGKTPCIGYVHTMEHQSDLVAAVLKKINIRKSIFIGHSMGGYVALAFAEKYPEKIKGLCLLNSTSNNDDPSRQELRSKANAMAQTNFANMVKISFLNLFKQENKTLYQEDVELALKEALQTPIQGYIAANEGMRIRPNRNNVLLSNDLKKLIIAGKDDPVLNYKDSIQEGKKTKTPVLVLEGGHMSHIENLDEVQKALISFCK